MYRRYKEWRKEIEQRIEEVKLVWKEEWNKSRKGIVILGIAVGVLSWDEEWVLMISYIMVMLIIVKLYGEKIGEYIDEECKKEMSKRWREWEEYKHKEEEEEVYKECELGCEENKRRIREVKDIMKLGIEKNLRQELNKSLKEIIKVEAWLEVEEESREEEIEVEKQMQIEQKIRI